MTKKFLLPVVFFSLLLLQFTYAEPNSMENFRHLLSEFGSEEKVKEKLCSITSINGHAFSSYASTQLSNGTFERKHLESLMGMANMYPDSLEYALFSEGVSLAAAGESGEVVAQKMMNRCMDHTPEEVRDMSASPSQRAKDIELQEHWVNTGCDKKMDKLAQASIALENGETDVDEYLNVVDDAALRLEMRAAASESSDLFTIYAEQYAAECGLSSQQIEQERKLEPNAKCIYTVAQLDDLYYEFQDTGNLNKARKTLSSLITQATARQRLLNALETDENYQVEVTHIFDNHCQSL